MEEKVLFELNSAYRDNMRIKGYSFGSGEKSACIVGATRGNEVQQLYICSRLINIFKQLEQQGKIKSDKSIMVVPTINNYSMNIGKRFWSTDNTDINRMFPGYNLGETTQRIAAGVFDNVNSYKYGIQFTSFYMQGDFIPHVRMMKTGFEDIEFAKNFGLPYVFRREARPYDTTTLNYNWQIWDTKAFSVYTNATDSIDVKSAREAINAVLSFLNKRGIIEYKCHEGYISQFIEGKTLVNVKSATAGIFVRYADVDARVKKDEKLAEIMHPYSGEVIDTIKAPVNGIVFFHANQPIIYSQTPLFRIIPTDDLI
ncbi:MAG: succinylglutamate desuccinylase/aspartoacylase family protein [Ruminococcus sp.]|nr:succinylglutamate desuccinylase/aspartoacylase family protein [Ruminococcus sp.]